MKILVLGSNGQLGQCLRSQLNTSKDEIFFTTRDQIDVQNLLRTRQKIAQFKPEVVINTTAYTSVDKAQDEQEIANLVNHLAVKNIANSCEEVGCWFVHISTDYVFDGISKIPYTEDDIEKPISVYGKTKLLGENAIRATGCRHVIIRTAGVYSEYGINFLKKMLILGASNNELRIVSDQTTNPTYAQDLAATILVILHRLPSLSGHSYLLHFAGDKNISWFDFAHFVFAEASAFGLPVPNNIAPVSTEEYVTKAKRPSFSVLDCTNINRNFGVTASHFRSGVRKAVYELIASNKAL